VVDRLGSIVEQPGTEAKFVSTDFGEGERLYGVPRGRWTAAALDWSSIRPPV